MSRFVLCHEPGDVALAEAASARLPGDHRLAADPAPVMDLVFAEPVQAIVVVGAAPGLVLELAHIDRPIVWALGESGSRLVAGVAQDDDTRELVACALARADVVADAFPQARRAIEDVLGVGVPDLPLEDAPRQCERKVAVVLGAGLGNMMNASPMIRWLSERTGRRVDLIIHGGPPVGAALFNDAPWVNFVFPADAWTVGRRYWALISTAHAGHAEPFCSAEHWIQQNKAVHYNVEGRFIREVDIYFQGLDELFGPTPGLDAPLPPSFLRALRPTPDGEQVVGIAYGIKEGVWAKRQWPHMPRLAARLIDNGWTVRCFGLEEEWIPGTENHTGLSIRETVERIARCALFVGHDGGMVHVAETLGVPALWLFGPTAYLKNGPLYEHSRILSTRAPCGPCNFKADWFRCPDAACMAELEVDEVAAALEEMHTAPNDDLRWRPIDRDLMAYELAAIERPSRADLAQRGRQERLLGIPATPRLLYASLGGLLAAGDVLGAVTALDAMQVQLAGDPLVAALAHALAAQLPGDPAATASGEDDAVPELLVSAILEMELRPREIRGLLESLMFAWLRRGQVDRALALLRAVVEFGEGPMHNWGVQRWVRGIVALRPAAAAEAESELRGLGAGNRDVLTRLNHVFDHAAVRYAWQKFRAVASGTAHRGAAPGHADVREHVVAVEGDEIAWRAGPASATVRPWDTILIVVQACDPRDRRPGSAAAVLTELGRRLAALQQFPVIATVNPVGDGVPFVFRDNVSYIQGSPLWGRTLWGEIVRDLAPALVISVDGAAEALMLDLPPATPAIHLTTCGLHDPHGLGTLLCDELGLLAPIHEDHTGEDVVPVDAVLDALPWQRVLSPTAPHPRAGGVALLLDDVGDLRGALRLVRRNPFVDFTVIGDVIHRGADPNVVFVDRRGSHDWDTLLGGADVLVQYGRAPATLCAEARRFLRDGRAVVAVLAATNETDRLIVPPDPTADEDWVLALRRALAGDAAPANATTP